MRRRNPTRSSSSLFSNSSPANARKPGRGRAAPSEPPPSRVVVLPPGGFDAFQGLRAVLLRSSGRIAAKTTLRRGPGMVRAENGQSSGGRFLRLRDTGGAPRRILFAVNGFESFLILHFTPPAILPFLRLVKSVFLRIKGRPCVPCGPQSLRVGVLFVRPRLPAVQFYF